MIGFIIGFILGSWFGMVLLAILIVGKDTDKRYENLKNSKKEDANNV